MLQRFWRPVAFVMLVVALAAVGGTAVAKSKKAPNKATITMRSPIKVKINKFIQDGSRFVPGSVAIRSGGTLTLENKSDEPHTFSIVTKKDLPKNLRQIGNCGAPGTVCEALGNAHQFDQDGNPAKPIVDVGSPGIDQAGDSFAFNPKQTQKVNVSAQKGTTLYFFCIIHPWMQGALKVR